MCLLVAKPAGVTIEKKYLKNGFRENPHGAGFVFAVNGKLVLRKGFSSFNKFWKAARDLMDYPGVIHFRWKSVGAITTENCHPFAVDTDLAFGHNGTIRSIKTEGDFSDTRQFNKDVLQELRGYDPDFLSKKHFKFLLEECIGLSKMAFVDKDGTITILNQRLGQEHEGTWFSNGDYLKTNPIPSRMQQNTHYGRTGTGVGHVPVLSADDLPEHYRRQGYFE